jgi:hypothetical protein
LCFFRVWESLPIRRTNAFGKGIAIVGVFAYAEPLKVVVMFQQFGLDEKAGGIGA